MKIFTKSALEEHNEFLLALAKKKELDLLKENGELKIRSILLEVVEDILKTYFDTDTVTAEHVSSAMHEYYESAYNKGVESGIRAAIKYFVLGGAIKPDLAEKLTEEMITKYYKIVEEKTSQKEDSK